ncbi:MAG: L,D-transpeptidase [Pseudorhodoplanes sp.]
MKLQVFFAASAFAFTLYQASAQEINPAPVKHAAAPAAANHDLAPAAPRAEPASAPASAPATQDAAPAAVQQARPRIVRRPPPQQPEQRGYWSGFIRGYNQPGAPDSRYARPQLQTRPQQQAARPQQQAAPQSYYAARPAGNRLFLGMFYSQIPKETVAFNEKYPAGTIIVRQSERRLYYVLGNGQALRYAVAVGREGAAWAGVSTVSNKREWPTWTPTPEILRRQPNLPRFMEGGPQNPMGARALYLGDTLYRIHGTNEPWMIGEEVSSGCIRMTNEDVIDLYGRARVGATVIVQR